MIDIEEIRKDYGIEVALIILVCRVYFKTATEIQVEDFVKKHTVDWNQFLISTSLHGVRPVVFNTLLFFKATVPEKTRELMKKQLAFLIANHWNLTIETERLILLLKANNINVLPYKGSAFGKEFFGDLTSRESSDIDLTIKKEDLAVVILLMEQEGYLVFNKMYAYLGVQQYLKEFKDISFNKFRNGIRLFHVEFHWAVEERFLSMPQQVGELFARSETTVTLFKTPLAALNPSNHFVAIMINHIWRDVLKDIKPLVDIGKCFDDRAGILNWDEVNLNINNLRLKKGFNLATLLLDQLFGIRNENYIGSEVPKKDLKQFKKHALRKYPTGWIYPGNTTFVSSQLSLRENLSDKFKFSLAYLRYCFYPTEIDLEIIKLPKSIIFLYPVLRFFRILGITTKMIFNKKSLSRNA